MVRTLLLSSLIAAPLLGQGDRVVTLGDRVRIVAPKAGYKKITGNVVSTTPDVVSISLERSPTEIAVPRDHIDRLFLSVNSRRNAGKGAILGAAVGAGFALWFGPKEGVVPGSTVETGKGSTKNLVTGAISGAALGALIGYFARTDDWVELSPRSRLP